jgi:hypothetical protein
LILSIVFITVLEMKTFSFSMCRVLGLSALAFGLSSCSLFKNGKYASQWEIQSEVPASLNSGEATVPGPVPTHTVQSNLSGADQLALADGSLLDLPMTENGGLVDVPKPEWAMTTGQPGQSPVELLSVPGGQATDLPTASYTNADLTNLLPAPPAPVTEEDLVLTPGDLAPEVAEIPAGDLPLTGAAPESLTAATGKTVASAKNFPMGPTIPLLYGQLDLSDLLNPALFAPSAAPTTASAQ